MRVGMRPEVDQPVFAERIEQLRKHGRYASEERDVLAGDGAPHVFGVEARL